MEEKELNVRGRSRAKGANKAEAGQIEKTAAAPENNVQQNSAPTSSAPVNNTPVNSAPKKGAGKVVAGAIAAAAVVAIGGYVGYAQQFNTKFFPNTSFNGIDVSGKTAAEVEQMVADGISGFSMNIQGREGAAESINGSDIDLHAVFDGSIGQMIAAQNPYEWIRHMSGNTGVISDTTIEYDENKLTEAVKALSIMDKKNMKPAEDAKVSDYIPGKGFEVIPETQGTEINEKLIQEAVKNAVDGLQAELNLDEAGVYEEAKVKADDPKLLAECEQANKVANVAVTYTFGDATEACDGTVIKDWIKTEGSELTIDPEKAAEYVKGLAEKYDTYNKPKRLKTTKDGVVEITKGNYGWKIDQEQTTAALLDAIKAGNDVTMEPVYLQEAAAHGDECWGDTYVEVNLTRQHLYYYKDGKLVIETDFVSGNTGRGTGTPSGAYSIAYTQRNAVLRGPGYASPVSYWMPFNGGIGLHDATWRGSFGGTIYKTNGSHGCVNLPKAAAGKIFENIQKGCPVLCYVLNGEEHNTSRTFASVSIPAPNSTTTAAPAEIQAPVETLPAPETQPAVTGPSGPGGALPTTPAATGPAAAGPGAEAQAPAQLPQTPAPAPEPAAPAPAPAPAPSPVDAGMLPGGPGM